MRLLLFLTLFILNVGFAQYEDYGSVYRGDEGVPGVVYAFGGEMTLALDSGVLMWRNNPEAANQEAFAYNALLNTLRTAAP